MWSWVRSRLRGVSVKEMLRVPFESAGVLGWTVRLPEAMAGEPGELAGLPGKMLRVLLNLETVREMMRLPAKMVMVLLIQETVREMMRLSAKMMMVLGRMEKQLGKLTRQCGRTVGPGVSGKMAEVPRWMMRLTGREMVRAAGNHHFLQKE